MSNNNPGWRLCVQALAVAAVVLPLAGCGSGDDLSRSIGLTRDAPDEFTVTTRAPLSMPPDFTIRPPQPGASRPQERSASASAQAALSPQTALATQSTAISPGEQALLQASGPQAPAGIRDDVNKDAHLDTGNPSLTDRLMFWKSSPQPGVVVDPTREAQRLRENSALGQSTQAGDTPIIQRQSSPLLNGLFDKLF
jgi:hypothetical protein